MHRRLAFIHILLCRKEEYLQEEYIMRKMKFGILLVFAVLALVSVASAALPAQVTATIGHPGPVSYWDVDVTVGGGDIPAANDYIGWCEDSQTFLGAGTHVFMVYSSLGALPAGLPTVDWHKVNYVINHKAGADQDTIQAVIWHYDGRPVPVQPYNPALYAQIVNDADANGAAYVPDVGEMYAVILWSSRTAQPVFIELPVPDIPVPEFPTLALPVAMLIGVVGVVQYVRARKE
jgi:hypothetical protein